MANFLSYLLGPVAGSMYYGAKAQEEQRDAIRMQRKQQALQEARQKRDMIRQSRMAIATTKNNSENQGVSGSSSALGGIGSIMSQLGSNLSFLDQYGQLSDRITNSNMRASKYAQTSQTLSDVASLAMSATGSSGQIMASFNSIFGRTG